MVAFIILVMCFACELQLLYARYQLQEPGLTLFNYHMRDKLLTGFWRPAVSGGCLNGPI